MNLLHQTAKKYLNVSKFSHWWKKVQDLSISLSSSIKFWSTGRKPNNKGQCNIPVKIWNHGKQTRAILSCIYTLNHFHIHQLKSFPFLPFAKIVWKKSSAYCKSSKETSSWILLHLGLEQHGLDIHWVWCNTVTYPCPKFHLHWFY